MIGIFIRHRQPSIVEMVKMLIVLNVVSVALMTPHIVVQLSSYASPPARDQPASQSARMSLSLFQLAYCCSAEDGDGERAYIGAIWVYFASTVAKPVVYVVLNGNFRRGCKEMMCMSAMRCYRSHAYTITTTSTLAKKNHVGVAVVIAPPRSSTSPPPATVVDSPPGHGTTDDDGGDRGLGGSWWAP